MFYEVLPASGSIAFTLQEWLTSVKWIVLTRLPLKFVAFRKRIKNEAEKILVYMNLIVILLLCTVRGQLCIFFFFWYISTLTEVGNSD